ERQAHRLDGAGHGVGGVHAAAGAGTGAGLALDLVNALRVELAGLELPDRLEDRDDVDRVARLAGAGQDAAAVDEDAGAAEPGQGQDAAGHVVVAAADGEQAVVVHAAGDDLEAVGDDLARDEAVAHALVAHHDAVGGGRGAEDLADAAGGADALDGLAG